MTNIAVRKSSETANVNPNAAGMQQQQQQAREWDPARLMRSFFGWDPFREMALTPFGQQLDQSLATFAPAFEVKETKDSYLFKADVPGVKQQDIDVTLNGNRLSITGKREAEKEEKSDAYYTYERSYGSFTRAFTMPEGVDQSGVHADLRDGVLTINVAKKPSAQAKKVPISTPQDKPKA